MPSIASSEPLERGTLRFARFIVRHRLPVAALLGAATLFFLYPSANASLSTLGWELPGPSIRIGARARDLFPDHPFIRVQDRFSETFGNSSLVAVAVVVEKGTVFTPGTLARIKRVTDSLDGEDFEPHLREREELSSRLEEERGLSGVELRKEVDRRFPPYPVNHDQVRSLVHLTTRTVELDPDGGITTALLIPSLPETQAEADAIRRKVLERAPELLGALVSRDQKAALVTASFVTDRLENPATYRTVFDHVHSIVEREEDENHRLFVTGTPIVTGWVLAHAWEIGLSMVGAVVLIFGLLWGYFRRWHGVLIPSVAAVVTVIWGLGFIGWMGIVLDPLVLVIPMIITARAVSHTVQMAERFFEDYERLAPRLGDPQRAKLEAASVAMGELIVPGTLGILTDVAGLLVILVTTIPQMRDLGIFGAFWVAAIVFTVEILHPVLICSLPPPREHRHRRPHLVLRFTEGIANLVTHPIGKWIVAGTTLVLFCAAGFVTLRYSRIGDANPGVALFWPDHPVNVATGVIGEHFGGVDNLVVYGEGDRPDSVGEQRFLLDLEELERTLRRDSGASGSLSLPLLVRHAQQLFHGGDPKFHFVPPTAGVWVLMMRTNSPPGALGPIVDPSGRATASTIHYRDHKGETIERAVRVAERFIAEHPTGEIMIRLERDRARPGAPLTDPERLLDFVYYMVGPLLPTRAHTLRVKHRTEQGYEDLSVVEAAESGLPPWMEEFREAALERYEDERLAGRPGTRFLWPKRLADWNAGDVDQWWDGASFGIRAIAVNTRDLLVQDLRSPDEPAPIHQPTLAWTRGAHFQLAGGVMGILSAVNEEVERGHRANISLILLVIFLLHSTTYRSLPSGAIVLLQISTATLFSLAYMAVRGIGLNINTLPVQAVGVGIGVDYAIYIIDRIRQEVVATGDVDEAIRRAVCTTGMAVTFTATTVVGGIVFWVFSNLRFQAEMAQLLCVLMIVNMLGAITVVPAFYSIVRPKLVTSRLRGTGRLATPAEIGSRKSAA